MRHQSILFIVPMVLILAFVLAACGTNSGSGSSTGSTPTSAPTTVKDTPTGCPSDAVVTPPPAAPNVTIRLTNSNGTIVAHNGDLIEVRLPFGQQWSLPTTTGNVLQLQTPAGYAVSADKVCIWHFIAKSTGTATLSFSAKAICKPGQMCPLYIMRVPFTIDVK
jgi:predicted small secreted protein